MKVLSVVTLASEARGKPSTPWFKRQVAVFEAKFRRTDTICTWRRLTLLGAPIWCTYSDNSEHLIKFKAQELAKELSLEYREGLVQGSEVQGVSGVELLARGV
jgi:hypothetical protein